MSGIIDPDHKPPLAKEIMWRAKSAFAVLLALAVFVGGGIFVYNKASDFMASMQLAPDYEGVGTLDVTVTIPSGAGTAEIGDILVEADVVKSTAAFLNAVRDYGTTVNLQAGTFKLKSQMAATEALKLLLDPASQLRQFFVVQEGLRLSQQLAAISQKTNIPLKDLEAAAKDREALKLPSYAPSAEGFLFPNTYEYNDSSTAASVLGQMSSEFGKVASTVDLESAAAANKVTPLQLVIIASIIEREVNRDADRPKAARVIYNRLAKDMKLQMDSTVHYAVNDYQHTTTTDAQRASKSPYNTYVNTGLPPGPISAPGRASLEAAANPEAGAWIYFVTVNLETGETKFGVTDQDHDANVKEFQAWCQANPGKC